MNENAFETWSVGNIMWLRDLLPHTIPFDNSRVMTYGYNCERGSKAAILGLKGWADDLLQQLCLVRTTDEVSNYYEEETVSQYKHIGKDSTIDTPLPLARWSYRARSECTNYTIMK